MRIDRVAVRAGLSAAVIVLAGCGGGGGGGGAIQSTPVPPPTAAPAPTPAPAAAPPVVFETEEYRRSVGLAASNVLPAYRAGASGAGVTVAVIDSGIAQDNPEFAGRIAAASTDLVAGRGIADEGGHGTAVSSVLLGARNGSGTHGVAYGATLLALRTDTPGTCTGAAGDCTHNDGAIARALDIAVAQNARVANLSLGGSAPTPQLRAAMQRATAAGMVLVISAGNDSNPNPDGFALVATDLAIARNQIIIAGAIDADRALAEFSNRAGTGAAVYLSALGVGVRSIDETGAPFLYGGTSFSAPHIAGAAALLAQAFPSLSGAQIAELLLTSADDLGALGTDPEFGRGALNIGRAFAPRGGASLAGSAIPLALTGPAATLSPAMGDASAAGLGAVMLDGYGRAYDVDLGGAIAATRPNAMLGPMLNQPLRSLGLARGDAGFALAVAAGPIGIAADAIPDAQAHLRVARTQAGFIAGRLTPDTALALGFGHSGAALGAQLAGVQDGGFMVARAPGQALGFDRVSSAAASMRQRIGRFNLTLTTEQGDALLLSGDPRRPFDRAPYSVAGVSLDRRVGAIALAAGISRLSEAETVLGGRFGPVFGNAGAGTWFADLAADWSLGRGWQLGVAARHGWTDMAAGGIAARGGSLSSAAYALDLAGADVLVAGDRLALRLAQPLRVAGGGIGLTLPVAYDWRTGAVDYADRLLALTPEGREVAIEASYGRALIGGRIDGNLFWRRDPGHFAALPDDLGVALRWRVGL